jgi:hypothetical protein
VTVARYRCRVSTACLLLTRVLASRVPPVPIALAAARRASTAVRATRVLLHRAHQRHCRRYVSRDDSASQVRYSAATAALLLASAATGVQCRQQGRSALRVSSASVDRRRASRAHLALCVVAAARHRPRCCSVRTATSVPPDPTPASRVRSTLSAASALQTAPHYHAPWACRCRHGSTQMTMAT